MLQPVANLHSIKSAQVCLCLVVKVYVCCDFSGGVLLQAYSALHCTTFSILCSMYQFVVVALSVVLYCVNTLPLQHLLFVMNGSCLHVVFVEYI